MTVRHGYFTERLKMPDTSTMEPPVATSAPTSATPAPVPAAPAPAPAATRQTFEGDIGTVAPDALIDLMPAWAPPKIAAKGFSPPKPAASPAPAAPAPVAAPAAEPAPAPAAAATPAPDAPAAAPEPAKNWRIRAKDAQEALVFELTKNGATLPEAYEQVYGKTATAEPAPAAAPTPSPSAPEPDPVQVADQQITSLAAQVADLETQIDAAAESGDTKTALKLTRQQADLKISLDRTRSSRETAAQQIHDQRVNAAVENHRALEQQSITEMYEVYPDLADKKGGQRAAFNAKVQALQKDPAFGPKFREVLPGWPLMVARMVDAEQGWNRTVAPVAPAPDAPTMTPAAAPVLTPQPSAATPSQVPPPRASAAALISPSDSPGGTAPTLDAKSFWRDSDNTDPSVLIGLMAHAPIDPKLLRAQRLDPRRF